MQLDHESTGDELTDQIVELAFELGMIMGDDFVVIPKDNRTMVLKAKRPIMREVIHLKILQLMIFQLMLSLIAALNCCSPAVRASFTTTESSTSL